VNPEPERLGEKPIPAVTSLTGLGAERLLTGADRVAVVGAGGWLGLATLELLYRHLGADAFAQRVVAFGSTRRRLELRGPVTVIQERLEDLPRIPAEPTLVLHLAFLTQEKANLMDEETYVSANRAITSHVMASLEQIGAQAIFLPSSGAVYKVEDERASSAMRLYGGLKLEDERAVTRWAEQNGRRAAVARVFNLAGPYINKQTSYALACFIKDALAGRPVEIRAAHPVFRSFVAISELMSIVFGVLTDASSRIEQFDTAGESALEMSDLARRVNEVLDSGAGILRPTRVSGPTDVYVGNPVAYDGLKRLFGVESVPLPSQIRETASFIEGREVGA
jgi:nucleoside-diphosphate-sugar epimerase